MTKFLGLLGIVGLAALLTVVSLFACDDVSKTSAVVKTQSDNFKIDNTNCHYVTVDDMPCLYCQEYQGMALTCKWTMWSGYRSVKP